jgi:predicted dithiol-disulfide oxidoreductase (DUF899 family)
MTDHAVVSREDWLKARRALFQREKEETHLRDAVNAERLALPWMKVDEDYRFQTPRGEKSLAELFDERSQLLVYHFMLAPDWNAGCTGCSLLSETFDGALPHLNHHDVTLTAVSRAPLDKIDAYKRRMGWHFPWVSSYGSDFNYDYHVSWTLEQLASGRIDYNFAEEGIEVRDDGTESPGMSAFFRDANGMIYHTYSAYARGIEEWIGTLMILDRAPKGRNEDTTMNFVRRHDEYQDAAPKAACH